MTERGERQKDELIEAAIELFASNGYAGTSIRDIAKLTGRSVSNVYHYFEDKEALWLAILEYSAKGIPERLRAALAAGGPPLERFRNLIRTHLQLSATQQREAKIFHIDEERLSPTGKRINRRIQKEILDIYLGELERLRAEGLVGGGNLRVLAFNVLGVINWHLRWQHHVAGIPAANIHEEMIDFILFGLQGARVHADRGG